MSEWNPKAAWDRLCRGMREWIVEDEQDPEPADPSMFFHLAIAMPLVIGVLSMLRRL
jgi:hypothetical protein